MKPKLYKCRAKGCKRKIELPYRYCSIECACYDGFYIKQDGKSIVNPMRLKELEQEASNLTQ